MKTFTTLALASLSVLALAGCGSEGGAGATRESIRAVGSSTVYPFAKAVAQAFAQQNPQFKSPLIETTGTGGGMKLFCAGLGAQTPDIENASRRMKASEFKDCQANGVKDVVEVQVGIDGIAFANATSGPAMALTPVDIYKAIAANPFGKPQTAKTWRDVNPALPATPIQVYGPATISGTRDALKELILEKACDTDPAVKAMKDSDKDKHGKICGDLRTDGAYADTSDNYNLVVQKIEANPQAVGIFGYSYLESNADKLKALTIDGVEPTFDNISSFKYPGARPLYIYYKKAHVGVIPGLAEFIQQWVKDWGKDGPLAKAGFIAAPADVQARNAAVVQNGTVMTGEGLE
ncbi:MAG: substrate-binding domain-containing protein [Tsuneonella sp.]